MKINALIPLLVYEDLSAAHDFLVNAFSFEARFVDRDENGNARHAEVRAGGTTIWMHRVTAEHGMASARTAASSGIVVMVDDVDAHYKRALANGAKVDGPPEDRPYGQREYGARDLEGHRWWFATPLSATVTS
jgi:uncharacterized glyoxalase superfamily protein PhnB